MLPLPPPPYTLCIMTILLHFHHCNRMNLRRLRLRYRHFFMLPLSLTPSLIDSPIHSFWVGWADGADWLAGRATGRAASSARASSMRAQRGSTALMMAAQNGHVDCAKELIRAGADVADKDNVRAGRGGLRTRVKARVKVKWGRGRGWGVVVMYFCWWWWYC